MTLPVELLLKGSFIQQIKLRFFDLDVVKGAEAFPAFKLPAQIKSLSKTQAGIELNQSV